MSKRKPLHVFVVSRTGELLLGRPGGLRFKCGPIRLDEGFFAGAVMSFLTEYATAAIAMDNLEDLGEL